MTKPLVKAIPDGMHSLTPHLVCDGAAAAIEFYKKAFGAVEQGRIPGPEGRLVHASVRIGDSVLWLMDEWPDMGAVGPHKLKGTPVFIHLYVPDADATLAQAVAAGATVTMPMADMWWGDRYGQVKDPFGHSWSIATHQLDLTPQELAQNMAKLESGGC
jgi:PhnB protein